MPRAIRQLEPFNGVAATGLAICNTSQYLGNTFDQIALKLAGGSLTKAMLNAIRVKANQKTIWDVTGNDLNTINLYNGHPAIATALSLMFWEPRSLTKRGRMAGAFDTSFGLGSVSIEADIVGATTPQLTGEVTLSKPLAAYGDPGLTQLSRLVRCLLKSPIPIAGALTRAPLQGLNLGSVAGGLVKRLYMFGTAGNITEVSVKRNGVDVIESLTPTMNSFYQDELAHDPQSGLTVVDFVMDDDLDNALATANPDGSAASIQVLVTATAADANFRVYADILAAPSML